MNRMLMYTDTMINELMETCVDHETGEIIHERFLEELQKLPDQKERAKECGLLVRGLEADCKVIDDEIRRLSEKKQVVYNEIQLLKNGINSLLPNYETIESPLIKIAWRKSEGVVETGEKIPDKYLIEKILIKIDKELAKKDLKNGIEIPGLLIECRQNLQIK